MGGKQQAIEELNVVTGSLSQARFVQLPVSPSARTSIEAPKSAPLAKGGQFPAVASQQNCQLRPLP